MHKILPQGFLPTLLFGESWATGYSSWPLSRTTLWALNSVFSLHVSCVSSRTLLDHTDQDLALGVHQFFIKAIAFQWIFAFVIMGVLFMATLAIAIPGFFGKELSFRREGDIVDADRERQPLLNDA